MKKAKEKIKEMTEVKDGEVVDIDGTQPTFDKSNAQISQTEELVEEKIENINSLRRLKLQITFQTSCLVVW